MSKYYMIVNLIPFSGFYILKTVSTPYLFTSLIYGQLNHTKSLVKEGLLGYFLPRPTFYASIAEVKLKA